MVGSLLLGTIPYAILGVTTGAESLGWWVVGSGFILAVWTRCGSRSARAREELRVANDRVSEFTKRPGGRVSHPIEVRSAAVIEPHVASLACPVCADRFRIVDDQVVHLENPVRRISAESPQCGLRVNIYFVVRAPPIQ